jgi:DnaJ-like protein
VELFAVIAMIAAGGAVAMFTLVAITLAKRTAEYEQRDDAGSARDRVAASILFHVLTAGDVTSADAMRTIRRTTGLAAPVTAAIDIATWAERYTQMTTPSLRAWLLESAVQVAIVDAKTIPLRQYAALLDLSFGLGFHTDALARLRERYHFDYIDAAKAGRPREADRSGGGAPLFVRERSDRTNLLRILRLEGEPSRQEIISAYRRIVAEVHPDRVHDSPAAVKDAAAARFIEITKAYEALIQDG